MSDREKFKTAEGVAEIIIRGLVVRVENQFRTFGGSKGGDIANPLTHWVVS